MPAMAMAIRPPIHLLKLGTISLYRLLDRSHGRGVGSRSSELKRSGSQHDCA
jgi:hypothetical protein